MLHLMRFGSINNILAFNGEVSQESKITYLSEKDHPFEIGKKYRYGRHFTDDLEVTILADSAQAEAVRTLLNVADTGDEIKLQWDAGKQIARIIQTDELPQAQRLKSAIRFRCTSFYTEEPHPVNVTAWLDNSVTTIIEKEIRMA